MFEPGAKLRHKKSGKIVKFTGKSKSRRGSVKIETEPLILFGFLDVQEFEAVEEVAEVAEEVVEEAPEVPEAPEELLEWTLKTSPEDYIKKAERGQKVKAETLALARKIVG